MPNGLTHACLIVHDVVFQSSVDVLDFRTFAPACTRHGYHGLGDSCLHLWRLSGTQSRMAHPTS